MKLGVSLLNLRVGGVGGIETYMRKLVQYAPEFSDEAEIVFFVNRDNCDVVTEQRLRYMVPWSEKKISIRRIAEAFTPWKDRELERVIVDSGVKAMLYPQQSMYPLSGAVPSLLIVADVQYLFSPQYYSKVDLAFRKRAYVGSMHSCTKIAAISQFTADHIYSECGIPQEKIEVIPHGHDAIDFFDVPADDVSLINVPYFYYPAATYRHKGHAQLFRTFAQLKREGRIQQKLVLSGGRTGYWKKLQQIIRDEGMQHEILHMGYLSYQQVKQLYQGADAILFPTEFEGFGLPVMEATQLHKKIICSRLPIFTEVGVPDAYQIDFSNAEELMTALQLPETVLFKEPLSWREAALQTFALLKEVATASCE